ncbi:MAG TPA: PilZ domain-containing protein [Spirochaetota bacterium]|nr:PilZ domain-containing protein [Spirochaetota bacterium]HNT11561.1 PilZ domain-containing protein [Spirochaetota bacterium]HNV45908.1 PilZ domain-containing protein [Spirochaetota bacterium]HOS40153.1 PilZ domain-containing protein [Spirochaetota bacterium]HPU90371.1 PilZ domain-containing protein [Spirochaetota bacterium]
MQERRSHQRRSAAVGIEISIDGRALGGEIINRSESGMLVRIDPDDVTISAADIGTEVLFELDADEAHDGRRSRARLVRVADAAGSTLVALFILRD